MQGQGTEPAMTIEKAREDLAAIGNWLKTFETMQQQRPNQIARAAYLQGWLDRDTAESEPPAASNGAAKARKRTATPD